MREGGGGGGRGGKRGREGGREEREGEREGGGRNILMLITVFKMLLIFCTT